MKPKHVHMLWFIFYFQMKAFQKSIHIFWFHLIWKAPLVVWCYCFFFMPPPLGAGCITFSGCLSVRPSVRSLKYPLLTCTWVRRSTLPTMTILRHVRPSICPSIRRGFWAFAREHMEGMAWNFTCWCILTLSRTVKFSSWPWSVDFYIFGTILT